MATKLKPINKSLDQHVRTLNNELSQLDADIKSKIAQMPDRCRDSSLVELNRYSHAIRERLNQFENKITEFEQLIHQTSTTTSSTRKSTSGGGGVDENNQESSAMAVVDRYRTESRNNLQNLRRVTLAIMQSIEKREREQLFHRQKSSSDSSSNLKQRQKGGVAGQSSDLTESLTSLVRHMDTQVRQSEATLTALVGSSQNLNETETEFKEMGSTIKSSGKLLSKYGRREITDKLLIFLALTFFFATCFYIVKKRLLGHFF